MARIKPDPHIGRRPRPMRGRAGGNGRSRPQALRHCRGDAEAIDAAKAKASQLAEPADSPAQRIGRCGGGVRRLNRQDLFARGKSVDLGFGVIGFRASTKIVQVRGITAGMTLEKLRQYNLTDGIRTKEEINKDAALGWPDERLELVGLRRQQTDAFYIEIKADPLPQDAA